LALTGQARRVAAAWLEQSMGDSCSALDAREAVRFRDARTIGPERTIEGGFGELAARLARGLEVRLGSPVRRIERGSWTRVELATGERIAAETVVVTVPPSVLGQGGLYLGEVLPDDKREAARVLRSCDAMSIVVRTEHTADRAAWTLVVEPLAGLWQLRPGQRWVLGVAKGSAAAGLRELAGDRQRLQRMIGLVAPQLGRVEEVVSCDWGRDPWSRGGFSTAIVGGEDAARAWATPIGGRVFFAGEATADRSGRGLVQGALTSGRRAAEEVLARHDR
ncbi:MAG TPA: FAD-dependent oxidoreductase, partial [Arachnia sp.]|nr:FAD-dependent oxidoreductase [Arachnia sp.]